MRRLRQDPLFAEMCSGATAALTRALESNALSHQDVLRPMLGRDPPASLDKFRETNASKNVVQYTEISADVTSLVVLRLGRNLQHNVVRYNVVRSLRAWPNAAILR